MLSFLHGGRMGDLIFGLSAIRELGGGILYLTRNFRMHRNRPGSTNLSTIMPFLHTQPYLKEIRVWDGKVKVTHDLRDFPNHSLNSEGKIYNLVDMHRAACGLDHSSANHNRPWLQVDKTRKVIGRDILIHRSLHYRNINFPWSRLLNKFRDRAFFVGLVEEYQDFINKFGWIEYVPTPDINEVLRLLSGVSLFIGNQGAPFALAEGLKKPVFLEACCTAPSCIFPRHKMYCYWCGSIPLWPSVYKPKNQTDQCWEF